SGKGRSPGERNFSVWRRRSRPGGKHPWCVRSAERGLTAREPLGAKGPHKKRRPLSRRTSCARSGGAGGELNARVQSEIGVEFYRLSRSLESYSLTRARQSVKRASR